MWYGPPAINAVAYRAFGTRDQGSVEILNRELPVPAGAQGGYGVGTPTAGLHVVSWTPTRLEAVVPSGHCAGLNLVCGSERARVGHTCSNSVCVCVITQYVQVAGQGVSTVGSNLKLNYKLPSITDVFPSSTATSGSWLNGTKRVMHLWGTVS